MKQFLFLLIFYGYFLCGYAQSEKYWQQEVNFDIEVTLNDSLQSIEGKENFEYVNHSPDSLPFLWIHLWPNAYKNDRTAFSEQMLLNGKTNFYFSNENQKGYINQLDFLVNGEHASTEDHPEHQDIVKLILPRPLAPGKSMKISTPFHVKLPFNFSRGGYFGQAFQVTQWFPKPAVYDREGWHPMPYLDQGEFYSEYGHYNVTITLKDSFTVAATGVLTSRSDNNGMKTLKYAQSNIHDFAWFADKKLKVDHDTVTLGKRIVDLFAYHYGNTEHGHEILGFMKRTLLFRSELIGEYPYPVASVVESPQKGGGGMEYPTITLIDGGSTGKSLDLLIEHEVGHNWFYGILGSNEREHPWMDEGMNTYYDRRYEDSFYLKIFSPLKLKFIENRIPDHFERVLLKSLYRLRKDQPIETSSSNFNSNNYNLIAYYKSAEWLKKLEEKMGKQSFDSGMKHYFNQWSFAHPSPKDFRNTMQQNAGIDLETHFTLLNQKGDLSTPARKKIKLSFLYNLKDVDHNSYIGITPIVGYNLYDKLMVGGAFHNFILSASRFQIFAAPLYSYKTKQFNGLGCIAFDIFTKKDGSQLKLSLQASKFTTDRFYDDKGNELLLPFFKIVPGMKYTASHPDPRVTRKWSIQWKTFLIKEKLLQFSSDSSSSGSPYSVSTASDKRYLNQICFNFEDTRMLYPYNVELKLEQGDGFLRTGVTAEYFFNYPKGGGMQLRGFFGKFIYTSGKNFRTAYETDRYHLNMTGANGYEDYTYSDYFAGRNIFDGFAAQQIMRRDGFFKVRSDLLSDKIGKTDDWLTAINFTSSIPKSVNPLEILPLKIPLKAFADFGTYAEAWKPKAPTEKLLYDAGLQLSFLKDAVNIFVPIISSKSFRDYSRSTITEKRFLKSISFCIDIKQLSIQHLLPELSF